MESLQELLLVDRPVSVLIEAIEYHLGLLSLCLAKLADVYELKKLLEVDLAAFVFVDGQENEIQMAQRYIVPGAFAS